MDPLNQLSPFEILAQRFFTILIFLFLSIFSYSQERTGSVVSIQDGDSFVLKTQDSVYRIRLFGIDCPEINQPFGEEATIFLSQYLQDSVVIIEKDVDKYGRTVADVFYQDTLLNYLLLEKGLAWHYTKYSNDTILAEAEKFARNSTAGLWIDQDAIAPWDWRAGNFNHSVLKQGKDKVFMCMNLEDSYYHNVHYCALLTGCRNTVALVFPNEAETVYKRRKCQKCLNLN